MRHRTLGSTGLSVSEIGFGAWALGGFMWGGARDEDSRRALRRAIERGVNFIDTALVYGQGHSEKLVGEIVRERRGGGTPIYVASKVPPKTFQWPAPADAKADDVFPRDWIVTSCEKSLRNLGLETIDLLQLHVWADAWTDTGEWAAAFDELKRAGKIRHAGVSINSHQPNSALRLVRAGLIESVQVIYNLFDQSPEDELFPACLEHHVGVVARVPFDESSLTGKLRHDTKFPEGDFRSTYYAGELLTRTVDAVEKMRPIVEKAAGTMARGALRFCLSHPAVSTVIPGMRSDQQVDENTAAGDEGPLPAEVLARLRPFRWVRSQGA